MRKRVLLKKADYWPPREEWEEPREILRVTLDEGDARGDDLAVPTTQEVHSLASEFPRMTHVMLELDIDTATNRGNSALLRATAISECD